ncbi:MAG: hypothetical protein HQL75_10755 [Magnetococcales bacterium]|nr:hypothetical protein [Magnetococcales bacterium]
MSQSKTLVSCIVFSLILSGCATGSQMSDRTATTAQGAGAGAVIGAITGAALSHNDRGKGALIGGIVGLLAGSIVGDQVAQMKQQRIAKEENLDQQIAQTNEYRVYAQNYQGELQQTVARISAESATLQRQRKQGQLNQQDLQNHLASITKQRDNLNKTIAALEDELQAKKEVYAYKTSMNKKEKVHDASVSREKLDLMQQEMAQLRTAINAMSQEDRQLAEMSSEWR